MQSSLRNLRFRLYFRGFGGRFTHTSATLKANTLDAPSRPRSHFAGCPVFSRNLKLTGCHPLPVSWERVGSTDGARGTISPQLSNACPPNLSFVRFGLRGRVPGAAARHTTTETKTDE